MIGAFFHNWGGAFADTGRFARALPLVVVLMIGIEILQHIVEARLGMFAGDPALRTTAAAAPVRMLFGWPKMAMVYLLAFFAMRWLVTEDRRATLRPTTRAIGRYALVALFQTVIAAVIIYARPIADLFGAGEAGVLPLRMTFGLFQQLAEPALALWYVNAAMGTRAYGPVASARATGWLYLWALPLLFLSRLPFNAVHQLLNRWPAGKPAALLWPMLIADAAIVGVLVVFVAAIQLRIARYVAARRGCPLLG